MKGKEIAGSTLLCVLISGVLQMAFLVRFEIRWAGVGDIVQRNVYCMILMI